MSELVRELNNHIVEKLELSPGMDTGTIELKQLIGDLICQYLPEMTLVPLSEYQDSEKQTYKYRCDKLAQENENLIHEIDDVRSQNDMIDANFEKYKDIREKFFSNAEEILGLLRAQMNQEIIVNDVKCYRYDNERIITESDKEKKYAEDDFSVAPVVYGKHRPSWFSPLRKEFNKENYTKRTADHTKGTLLEQLAFWKKVMKSDKPDEEKAKLIDFERRKNIAKLLNSNLSNEEKYLKYMLLTPGIPKDFLKTLTGAEELSLDANVVISYLEQSNSDFNREIFEVYVSQVRKGTDFNLKQEFADDLVRGDWYIVSDISGTKKKYQAVPLDDLKELREKIDSIASIIADINDSEKDDPELRAKLARSEKEPDSGESDEETAAAILDDVPIQETEFNEDDEE